MRDQKLNIVNEKQPADNNQAPDAQPQRRKSDRVPMRSNVLVYTDAHPDGIFATTVNWSPEGACILFSSEAKMPKRFFFRKVKQFSMAEATHCERIWQAGNEVGVAFLKDDDVA